MAASPLSTTSRLVAMVALVAVALSSTGSPFAAHDTGTRDTLVSPYSLPRGNVAPAAVPGIGGFFVENAGQVRNEEIQYYSPSGRLRFAFAESSMFVVLSDWEARDAGSIGPISRAPESSPERSFSVRVEFEGANPVVPRGRLELPTRSHYFLGSDPSRWRTNVRAYQEVSYENLYAGIDLVYRATEAGVKYEFVVHPGADPAAIRVRYEGAGGLSRDASGGLAVLTPLGPLRDQAPVCRQGSLAPPCAFRLLSGASYGFDCAGCDPSHELVVDPLIYATFLGGWQNDDAVSLATDSGGNAYVVGLTDSVDFPTVPGAFDIGMGGGRDAFVAKLDPAGSALVYATYLGGSGWEEGRSIAVDPQGNAYVTGTTDSPDFPGTAGAPDPRQEYTEAFVAKLNATGSGLMYATYLGGGLLEEGFGIAVDGAGGAVVIGTTWSPDFPTTPGAFDPTWNEAPGDNNGDVYVARVTPLGDAFSYATFLGGSLQDTGFGVAVSRFGEAFVTGSTESTDFPTSPSAFDRTQNGYYDAFVAKLSASGSLLLFSTYLGTILGDFGRGIAADGLGNVYVTGYTNSDVFPTTPGAYDPTHNGDDDAFIVKLAGDGASVRYSSFLGGGNADRGRGVVVDALGQAHVAGETGSVDFPIVPGASQATLGGVQDAFVATLSDTGTRLLESTYLGGGGWDVAYSLALDANGTYVAGYTESADFPATPGAFDTSPNGLQDAFVAKLESVPNLRVLPSDVTLAPAGPYLAGTPVQISATVHNRGLGGSGATVARFTDGVPPSPQIDSDQALPPLPSGGAATVSVAWVARPAGAHDICVVADPDDGVEESNETDNQACVPIFVRDRPDYVSQNASPSTPLAIGLSLPVTFSVEAANVGGDANASATLAFANASTPSSPFAVFPIPPIPAGGTEGPFVSSWIAPAVAGTYEVFALVDSADDVVESNESNNVFTWTLQVVPGPVTTLVIGQPNYTAGTTYVTSSTPLSLSVQDRGGTGIRSTRIWMDSGPWMDYMGPFTLAGEGEHFVEWYSEDFAGNVEPTRFVALRVDDTPPATTLSIGSPNYVAADTYVTSGTPLTMQAADGGLTPVGLAGIEYRVDGGPWTPYVGPFSLSGEGLRAAEYRAADLLGNVEAVGTRRFLVDDTPPETVLVVGDPNHVASQTFVTSATNLVLQATDGGATPVGVAVSEYRLDGGLWAPYASSFSLAGEGPYVVEYRSSDLLGNSESSHATTLVVDDTPPGVVVDVGTPRFDRAATYVTPATRITLTATDGGVAPVGLASLEYRVGGGWTAYGSPFTLTGQDGAKAVEYRAADWLGNAFSGQIDVVLDDTPPMTTPSPGDGTYPPGTTFAFTATDAGSGVARTEVRVDGGAWSTYTSPLALSAGDHTIGFRSVDHLNNTEAERTLSVTVASTPPSARETNWKPLVAAVFASVLALVGAWSATRAPWPSGSRRRVRAFAFTAAPFFVAEALTGVVSLLTGLLAIPPILGAGTAVDLGILVTGVVVLAHRVLGRAPVRKARNS